MEELTPPSRVRIGCAGWAIRKDRADLYGSGESHLARYAATFPAVEINSCFYKPHRRATYERWAASTPDGFRFAAKVPRSITHELRLVGAEQLLARFLEEVTGLGPTLGPLLIQLPPSFEFEPEVVPPFLADLRDRFDGALACEPRHPTWFTDEVDALLEGFRVARVAADPAIVERAGEPGGWRGLVYVRLHGSPVVYRTQYGPERLAAIARNVRAAEASGAETWCIFDNTAEGAAPVDALALARTLAAPVG